MEEKIAEQIEQVKKKLQYLAYSGTKKVKRYRFQYAPPARCAQHKAFLPRYSQASYKMVLPPPGWLRFSTSSFVADDVSCDANAGWRDKALYRWNMPELVDFFRKEIRVPSSVIHRSARREGSAML
eukprot:760850-Hanusia_phi.AAC.2